VGDLLRAIVEIVQYIWPLRLVHTWEGGGYYVFGRWWKEVGPGIYFIVPFFSDVKTISVASAIVGTGRQDITLLDGTTLSFSATVWAKIVDVYKAFNLVDEPTSTTQELLASLLADTLAETPVDRLRGSKRKTNNLFKDLEEQLKREALEFGVEIHELRFTSFVLGVKTHRFLIDQAPIANW
jgi:regulator of protease activity HflC (stomatin/prohibitin superfamily)